MLIQNKIQTGIVSDHLAFVHFFVIDKKISNNGQPWQPMHLAKIQYFGFLFPDRKVPALADVWNWSGFTMFEIDSGV